MTELEQYRREIDRIDGELVQLFLQRMAVTGQVSARDFITIFSIVIAFYFGTQSQNPGDDVPPAGKT